MSYVGFAHAADVANVGFILVPELISFFEFSESIDDDTSNNVLEKKLHKTDISNIEDKPSHFELIHIISDGPTGIKHQDTVKDVFTCITGNFLLVDHRGVSV